MPTTVLQAQRWDDLSQQITAQLGGSISALGPVDFSQNPPVVTIYWNDGHPTAQEQTTYNNLLAGFDWTQAGQNAHQATVLPAFTNAQNSAAQAIQTNNTFLALGSPTNAQVLAQVQALTRQSTAVIQALGEAVAYLIKNTDVF